MLRGASVILAPIIMPRGSTMSIQHYYDTATEYQRDSGIQWYHEAHALACQYAATYKAPLHIVAALISILSPSVSWERNLVEADLTLDAWRKGKEFYGLSTYGPQIMKASTLLADLPAVDDVLDYIGTPRALKTRAFYHNILKPNDPSHVTVDRWMLRAHGYTDDRITKGKYVDITNEVKRIALASGLVPCQVQAIVWQNIRSSVEDQPVLPGW